MIDQVVGESSTSEVAFDGNSFTSTTEDGIVSTCKR
jgi:hypothetical protein